jgi:hypothetical protein
MSWDTVTGESFSTDAPVIDLVRSVRNRCDAVLFLHKLGPDTHYVYPTLLEDMYEDCQELIDLYCIEG